MRLFDFRKFTITFVFVAALTLVVQAGSSTDAIVKDVAFSFRRSSQNHFE